MEVTDDLTPLGHQILEHWSKYRPRMVATLTAQNQLRPAIFAAQEQSADRESCRSGVKLVAQLNLAVLYDHGKGVAEDKRQAIRWWRDLKRPGQASGGARCLLPNAPYRVVRQPPSPVPLPPEVWINKTVPIGQNTNKVSG